MGLGPFGLPYKRTPGSLDQVTILNENNKTSLSNLHSRTLRGLNPLRNPFCFCAGPFGLLIIEPCSFLNATGTKLYVTCPMIKMCFCLCCQSLSALYFVDKLLNIYIIYFVAVSQCSQLLLLTTVFRQNAAGECVFERTPVWLDPCHEDQGSSHHSGGISHRYCNKVYQFRTQLASTRHTSRETYESLNSTPFPHPTPSQICNLFHF